MNILRNIFLCPYVAGTSFKRSSSGGAAALDAFSTIAGGISDLMIQRMNEGLVNKTNQANANIAMMNNESAEKIARENNEFQERLNTINNQFAHDEALAAFQRQTEWNDPAKQVKMVRAAGLNPSVYFGNGTAVGSTASPSAQPHGSGVQSSMPVLSTPQMQAFQYTNPSESIKNLADAAAALAGAKKQGVETDTLQKTQDDIMRRMKAEGDLTELQAYFEKKFGDANRSKALKQMDANIAKATEESYLFAKEGKFTEARQRLTEAQEATEKEMKNLRHEEAEQARKENEFAYRLIEAKIDNLQSQTSSNRANALFHTAAAKEIHELLPGKIHLQKAEYDERVANANRTIGAQWNERNLTLSQLAENEQLIDKYAADTALAYEQIYGVQLDNQQKRSLMKLVKMSLYYDNLNKMKNAVNPVQWVNGFMNLTPNSPAPAQITGFSN